MLTTGTPAVEVIAGVAAGPSEAGREDALGRRSCAGAPPCPEDAETKLGACERMLASHVGGRALTGAP
eukprot:8213103-Alexandrium_andersonii.AAC.1